MIVQIVITVKTELADNMKDFLINIGLAALAVFAPVQQSMCVVGVLIFIDLILGLYGAYKNGEPITSTKLKDTIVKMVVYQLGIISAFLAQEYLAKLIPFVNITLGYIALTEFKSIAENISKITKQDFLKYVKEAINQKLNKGKNE